MPDKVYTRKGDDGTTQLLFAGPERVSKADARVRAYGDGDEAAAALGVARALARRDAQDDVAELVLRLQRELAVLNAELATPTRDWDRLTPGISQVTQEMVDALETEIDRLTAGFEQPKDFIVPGNSELGAALDLACRIVRRAERSVIELGDVRPEAARYLNRLSDLVWVLARYAERSELQPRHRQG